MDDASEAPRTLPVALAAAAVFTWLQAATMATTTWGPIHHEEGATPALAIALDWIPRTDLFDHIYRPWCGGCAVEALAAQQLFGWLGDRAWVWGLIPLATGALLSGASVAWAGRIGGRDAAIATGLAWITVPTSLATLTVRAWGNHVEAAAVGTAALAVLAGPARARRTVAAGVLAGAAVWIGLSALYVPIAAVAWLLWTRRFRDVVVFGTATLATAGALWRWQIPGMEKSPFEVLHGGSLAEPHLSVLDKLAAPVDPTGIAALAGPWDPNLGLVGALAVLGAAGVAGVLGARRAGPGHGLVLLALAAWLVVYLPSPVAVSPPARLRAVAPIDLRYAAPLLSMLPLVLGLGLAAIRGSHPRVGAALLAAWMVPGVFGRIQVIGAPDDPAGHLTTAPAAHAPWFRWTVLLSAGDDASRWRCDDGDERCLSTKRYRLGVQAAHEAARQRRWDPEVSLSPPVRDALGPWVAGVAAAIAKRAPWSDRPWDDLDTLGRHLPTSDPAVVEGALREAAAATLPRGTIPWDEATDTAPWRAIAWSRGHTEGRRVHPEWVPPQAPPGVGRAWAEGFGQAVGLRYGTDPPIPAPAVGGLAEAYRAGIASGVEGAWAIGLP